MIVQLLPAAVVGQSATLLKGLFSQLGSNLPHCTQTEKVFPLKMAAANLSSWLNRGEPLSQKSHGNLPEDPLTLLAMVEVVLERCQHIIGFSPEAKVDRVDMYVGYLVFFGQIMSPAWSNVLSSSS